MGLTEMKVFNLTTDVKIRNAVILLVGSLLTAVAVNMFVGPAGLYVGGVTGILQIISMLFYDFLGIELSLGILILVANLPVLWLAWKSVGKRFAALTVVSVVLQSIFFELVPIQGFTSDLMVSSIFGGVLAGFGSGIMLKIGASSGGMDVVTQVISYKFDGSVGKYSFLINAIVIFVAGSYQSWEVAMFTIISIYITSIIVDKVHTIHQNVTLFMVTQKEEEIQKALLDHFCRGITTLEASGAYTKERRSVLMMVLSSYELYEVIEIIKAIDAKVFINIVRSESVVGHFVKKRL